MMSTLLTLWEQVHNKRKICCNNAIGTNIGTLSCEDILVLSVTVMVNAGAIDDKEETDEDEDIDACLDEVAPPTEGSNLVDLAFS